ncbi:MAG: SPFH domain-containing protein, partial [Bacteriovoracaceae bacterium]
MEVYILLGLILFTFVLLGKTARVVPQKTVFIIERLGKYNATLDAGFHILIPFIDRVAYKHSMKEMVI